MAEIYIILPQEVESMGSWGSWDSNYYYEYSNFADAEAKAKKELIWGYPMGVFQLVAEVKPPKEEEDA